MNNDAVYEILRQYEIKRDVSLKETLSKRDKLYKEIPELTKIDDNIKNIGIEITQAIFKEPDSSKKFLAKLKERLNLLKEQKAALLKSNGYPEDYLEQKYECNICKDTGFVNGKRCRCFEQKLINVYYKQSNIADIIKRENFQHFNFDYYSDKPLGDKPSPKNNIKSIVEFSLNFIKNFNQEAESLFFYGDSGLGKTYLANCIAKELLDRGKSVIYKTSPELIEGLRLNKLNPESSSYSEYLELLKDCDLLIIDDLGTEPITAFSLQEIFNLLNTRLLMNKKLIISTNLPLSEIMSIYPERIYSRIFGNFKMLNFYGEDIRLKRKIII